MRGLNEWLSRDVNDRQSELRGVTARIDQLRAELAQQGVGAGVIPRKISSIPIDISTLTLHQLCPSLRFQFNLNKVVLLFLHFLKL